MQRFLTNQNEPQIQVINSFNVNGSSCIRFFIINITLFILAACGGGGGSSDEQQNNTNLSPSISLFEANQVNVNVGQVIDLSWDSVDADFCEASNGWTGTKQTSGTESITINQSDTFSLICMDTNGNPSLPANVSVTVNNVTPAPTLIFVANPDSILFNGSSTLAWNTTNATSCIASGDWTGLKPAGPQNSETVGPLQQSRTYTLVCSGPGGTSPTRTATVQVAAPPPTPTVSVTAAMPTITSGNSTTLSWSSTNASACSAAWTSSTATSDSVSTGALNATTTFSITCTGAGGSATDSTTVTVNPAPLPTVNLQAVDTTITSGDSTTLSWSSTNASACSAAWTSSTATSDSVSTGALNATTTFSITCTGAGGSATDSVTVTVNPAPTPTVSLDATETTITSGDSTTLSWTSTNTDSCSATGGWTTSTATSDSESTGALNATTTFSITCTGAGGIATDSITIEVIQVGVGIADLSWTPPTTNEDGTALLDLDGYNVYQGASPNQLSIIDTIQNIGVLTYRIENLLPGTYYFSVTAIDSTGNESVVPNPVSKTIQ
ncbi:MAG: hypothetical protein AAF304_03620 [Pseudomonadota bacterium]